MAGGQRKFKPSVELHAGDAGPGEDLKKPTRKRGGKGHDRVLPCAMKHNAAAATRLSLYRQLDQPVPENEAVEMDGETGEFYRYDGIFNGLGVQVTDRVDMAWLYKQGFFGKGVLSKSEPMYGKQVLRYGRGDDARESSHEKRIARKKQRIFEAKQRKLKKEIAADDTHPAKRIKLQADLYFLRENYAQSKAEAAPGAPDDSEGATNEDPDAEADADDLNDDEPETTPTEESFISREYLQLSLEEAFFLAHALGCLNVKSQTGQAMTILEFWQACIQSKPNFVQSYVVYHFYRSRGWVPKTGLKFAADWLIYRQGPTFYHSSYSIVVRTAWADTFDPWHAEPTMSWHYLSAVSRVSGQAGKEAMVAYVVRPRAVDGAALRDPSCLDKFQVKELMYRRWVPDKAR